MGKNLYKFIYKILRKEKTLNNLFEQKTNAPVFISVTFDNVIYMEPYEIVFELLKAVKKVL